MLTLRTIQHKDYYDVVEMKSKLPIDKRLIKNIFHDFVDDGNFYAISEKANGRILAFGKIDISPNKRIVIDTVHIVDNEQYGVMDLFKEIFDPLFKRAKKMLEDGRGEELSCVIYNLEPKIENYITSIGFEKKESWNALQLKTLDEKEAEKLSVKTIREYQIAKKIDCLLLERYISIDQLYLDELIKKEAVISISDDIAILDSESKQTGYLLDYSIKSCANLLNYLEVTYGDAKVYVPDKIELKEKKLNKKNVAMFYKKPVLNYYYYVKS